MGIGTVCVGGPTARDNDEVADGENGGKDFSRSGLCRLSRSAVGEVEGSSIPTPRPGERSERHELARETELDRRGRHERLDEEGCEPAPSEVLGRDLDHRMGLTDRPPWSGCPPPTVGDEVEKGAAWVGSKSILMLVDDVRSKRHVPTPPRPLQTTASSLCCFLRNRRHSRVAGMIDSGIAETRGDEEEPSDGLRLVGGEAGVVVKGWKVEGSGSGWFLEWGEAVGVGG